MGNPIVYYKVTDDWAAARQTPRPETRGSLLSVASIILSTPVAGAEDVSSLCPRVDGAPLQAGGRYSWPPLRWTQRLLGGAEEVSRWETLKQCCKVNYQYFTLPYGAVNMLRLKALAGQLPSFYQRCLGGDYALFVAAVTKQPKPVRCDDNDDKVAVIRPHWRNKVKTKINGFPAL